MKWVYRGRCWLFGDDLAIDGAIMPLRFALARETDPMVLREHLMSELDPGWEAHVRRRLSARSEPVSK